MEIQKKQLKKMIHTKDQNDANLKFIVEGLMKYEDQNIDFYSDSDLAKRLITNPLIGDMKD